MKKQQVKHGRVIPLKPCEYPLFSSAAAAGFPSPAQDFTEMSLDLNDLLIRHPSATFFMRVEGDSMVGAGINDGDLLIVDRAIEAVHGRIVVAILNDELTVKRLEQRGNQWFLASANDAFDDIPITQELECAIWGCVQYVIHKV